MKPGLVILLGPLGSNSLGLGGAERSPPEEGGLYCGPEWTRVPEMRMPNAMRRKESSHKTLKEVGKLESERENGQVPSPDKVQQTPPVSKGFYLRDLVLHRTVLLGWRDGECGVICLVFLDPHVVFLTSDPKSSCSAEDFDSRYTWDQQQEPTS